MLRQAIRPTPFQRLAETVLGGALITGLLLALAF